MGQASMRHLTPAQKIHTTLTLTMPSGPHASSQTNCRVMERHSKPVQPVPSQGTKERRKEERKKEERRGDGKTTESKKSQTK